MFSAFICILSSVSAPRFPETLVLGNLRNPVIFWFKTRVSLCCNIARFQCIILKNSYNVNVAEEFV